MIDQTPINEHWCEFHWSPYRTLKANGLFACVALIKAIIGRTEFRATVLDKMHSYKLPHDEATDIALKELLSRERKPLCCVVGNTVMADILIDARGPWPKIPE